MEQTKLKFEGIPVGTKIRSYHFQPMKDRPDSYIEGTIIGVTEKQGAKVYEVFTLKDVLAGKEREIIEDKNGIYFVPMEVEPFEFDNRITICSQRLVQEEKMVTLDWDYYTLVEGRLVDEGGFDANPQWPTFGEPFGNF